MRYSQSLYHLERQEPTQHSTRLDAAAAPKGYDRRVIKSYATRATTKNCIRCICLKTPTQSSKCKKHLGTQLKILLIKIDNYSIGQRIEHTNHDTKRDSRNPTYCKQNWSRTDRILQLPPLVVEYASIHRPNSRRKNYKW